MLGAAMTQNRSFKDYVTNRFYNELFSAVSNYLEENHRNLDVSRNCALLIERNCQISISKVSL